MTHDFAQPEYLYRLAKSGSAYDRELLAHAVTSLLHQSLTEVEKAIAEDILLRLIQEAEIQLRLALAQQLAKEPSCPKALLRYLIYQNDFLVAEPVLRFSLALNDEDLAGIIRHFKTPDYLCTIAQRDTISEDTALRLIQTDEPAVFPVLLGNPGARLCPISMEHLARAALKQADLQEMVLHRPEATMVVAGILYDAVSTALRDHILNRFDINPARLDAALNDLRAEQELVSDQHIPDDMMAHAQRLKERHAITSRQLLDSLKQGDKLLFMCLWAALLDLDVKKLVRAFPKEPVELLCHLAHAACITRGDYKNMLLSWDDTAMDIAEALKRYDGIGVDTSSVFLDALRS